MTRLAIVGAGVMGSNHARVAGTLPDVEIVAVVEPDPVRGRELADGVGARYLPDVDKVRLYESYLHNFEFVTGKG